MTTLWQDLRYGVRMLRRSPGFTLVAVAALALGIGANTAIFSVVNAVLLRPLPYRDTERLMMLWETNEVRGTRQGSVSLPNFLDWRSQNKSFETVAAFHSTSLNRTDGGEPERLIGVRASPSFFDVLGVKPLLGRSFLPEEEEYGRHRVVVMSHGYWQRRFGSNPGVVGQALMLDGESFTVVGVLPPDFRFPVESAQVELWQSLSYQPDELVRGAHYMSVVGRLREGLTREQAQVEMNGIAGALAEQYPDTNAKRGINLIPLREQVVGDVRPALLVLLGAVGFVLLIACANVANLMLARTAAREREIAVRLALGATRRRLVRQFLTESVLLSLMGGALGLLLAWWGVDALVAATPSDIAGLGEINLDVRVLGFTVAVALLTGLIFGLAPALQAAGSNLNESLKEGGRSATVGMRRQRIRGAFVVSEVALALMLLVGAGLLIRSFLRLQEVKLGFDPKDVLTMEVNLPDTKYSEPPQQAAFFRQLLERAATLPGAQSVGAVYPLPLSDNQLVLSFAVEGRPPAAPGRGTSANWRTTSPGYFQTMRIPLLKGRHFTWQDGERAPKVIIINETMADRYFPGEDPLGKRLTIGYNDITCEIVGIVGDVKHKSLDTESGAEMYTPYEQTPWPALKLVVRTATDPAAMAAAVRTEVQRQDRDLPVYAIKQMDQFLSDTVARPRFNTLLLGLFAVVALTLSALGIYGVLSYAVAQRTHEIGVRMALGAQGSDVLRLVVGQGMKLALVGVAVGLVASLALVRVMASLLFGVSATDPVTFVVVSLLLSAVALVACLVPARRALNVDPGVALRYE